MKKVKKDNILLSGINPPPSGRLGGEYPKNELAQLVISACVQFDIDTVVVSPGSRNAPLTIGFSNHPKINALSVVDERSAAFFALGIAQQTQKPVAVVCTSGSALLNYYPAIAEAFYSNIPLVIISADRPKHLIDIGDGQTIRQENVYQNHILFSANLKENSKHKDENSKLIDEALQTASIKKGPVHINVPFDEPLYETVEALKEFSFPTIVIDQKKPAIDFNKLVTSWNSAVKKIILVGVHYPDTAVQSMMNYFAEDQSVLVLTETTSNLHHPNYINNVDQLITSLTADDFLELQPEILITFGGMVVSKRIKQFFRNYKPQEHWHIDAFKALDTYHCLSEFIQESPANFFKEFVAKAHKKTSNYQKKWVAIRNDKRQKHAEYLEKIEHSDLKVFEQVLNNIPKKTQVQFSNSAIIRYAQLFDIDTSLAIFCNRGTSGIDGSTSTAVGAAYASSKQTVFVSGDVSFFYDSNALWNTHIPTNFRIILINNEGGGIFKIIPGPASTNALSYFETPHQLTAEHLCNMHGLIYQKAATTKDVSKELIDFFKESKKPKLLEICTPSNINNQILKDYFKFLS